MSEVLSGNGGARSGRVEEETQPAPSPKLSRRTTWGSARLEVKPDLTAGDRNFGCSRGRRGQETRQECRNLCTSTRPWNMGSSDKPPGRWDGQQGWPAPASSLACLSRAHSEGWHIWAGHWVGYLVLVWPGSPPALVGVGTHVLPLRAL